MPVASNTPVTAADMAALAALANAKVDPATLGDGDFPHPDPWEFSAAALSLSPVDGPPYESPYPWRQELGMLRTATVFGLFSATIDPDSWIVSGPWCVAVGNYLFGHDASDGDSVPWLYKEVEFWFAEDDVPDDLELETGFALGTATWPTIASGFVHADGSYAQNALRISTDQTGQLECVFEVKVVYTGGGTPGAKPEPGDFTLTTTPATGVTWETEGDGSECILRATISRSFSAGSDQVLELLVNNPPTDYALRGWDGLDVSEGGSWYLRGFYTLETATDWTDATGIHPTSAIKKIVAATTTSSTTVEHSEAAGAGPWVNLYRGWQTNYTPTTGVWVAKTMPIWGLNCYCENDFAPYVTVAESDINHGAGGGSVYRAHSGQSHEIFDPGAVASSRYSSEATPPPKINTPWVTVTPRPTQWLVLRDTAEMPEFADGFVVTTKEGERVYESFSYLTTPGTFHSSSPSNNYELRVPPYGYCVYRLRARRKPEANSAGIKVAPETGAELAVKIGVMRAAVFEEFTTLTIPADEADVSLAVFWPVLSGHPLAWQCDTAVNVSALVNFQPPMHSLYSRITSSLNPYPVVNDELFNGPAYWSASGHLAGPLRTKYALGGSLNFFDDQIYSPYYGGIELRTILYPVVADYYNDLEAILNLLPDLP